jgi:hypothetical protein
MYLIRLIMAAQARKADREILRVLRRDTHHDEFRVELERRLLGQ